ncbi:hypothetical protein ASC66_07845 [Leifsonia sp. Root4]|nr:hypothetical protein ASC66_07845 [Leifsonia sp. Root4]
MASATLADTVGAATAADGALRVPDVELLALEAGAEKWGAVAPVVEKEFVETEFMVILEAYRGFLRPYMSHEDCAAVHTIAQRPF